MALRNQRRRSPAWLFMVCVYQDTHTQRDASIFFMEGVSQVTPSVLAALVANLCFNSELSAKICFRRQVGTGIRRLQIKEHTACLAANLCFQNGKTMGEVTASSSPQRRAAHAEKRFSMSPWLCGEVNLTSQSDLHHTPQ